MTRLTRIRFSHGPIGAPSWSCPRRDQARRAASWATSSAATASWRRWTARRLSRGSSAVSSTAKSRGPSVMDSAAGTGPDLGAGERAAEEGAEDARVEGPGQQRHQPDDGNRDPRATADDDEAEGDQAEAGDDPRAAPEAGRHELGEPAGGEPVGAFDGLHGRFP